jgi:hypothetical protein
MNDDFSNSILDETRALLRKQQTQLEDALQRVREAQEALSVSREIEQGTTHADAPATSNDKPRKRHMSAAAREASSKRMKAYWRKRRKAEKA